MGICSGPLFHIESQTLRLLDMLMQNGVALYCKIALCARMLHNCLTNLCNIPFWTGRIYHSTSSLILESFLCSACVESMVSKTCFVNGAILVPRNDNLQGNEVGCCKCLNQGSLWEVFYRQNWLLGYWNEKKSRFGKKAHLKIKLMSDDFFTVVSRAKLCCRCFATLTCRDF